MTSDLMRIAMGINEARLIVERQRQRCFGLENDQNIIKRIDDERSDSPRVFYDLPLRLQSQLLRMHLTSSNRMAHSSSYFSSKEEYLSSKEDSKSYKSSRHDFRSWRNDFRGSREDLIVHKPIIQGTILGNRKVAVTSAFKNIPDIEVLNEQLNKLLQEKPLNQRYKVARRTKVKVKNQVKIGKVEYKHQDMRSMSNLPIEKIDEMLQKEREDEKKKVLQQNNQLNLKTRHYDIDKIHEYIERKRIEAKRNKFEAEKRVERLKSYDSEEIKKYIKLQQKKRKQQQEKVISPSKCCDKKNYDQDAVREYMIKKKEEEIKQEIENKNVSPTKVQSSAKSSQISPTKTQKSSVKWAQRSPTKSLQTSASKSQSKKIKLRVPLTKTRPTKRFEIAPMELNFDQQNDNELKDNNLEFNNIENHNLNDNLKDDNLNDKVDQLQAQIMPKQIDEPDSSQNSPTKSPTKGHRRTQSIVNGDQLREMLSVIINENGDTPTNKSKTTKSPVIKVPFPSGNMGINGMVNGNLNASGSFSAVSSLTNSIGTFDQLSPLTITPDASFEKINGIDQVKVDRLKTRSLLDEEEQNKTVKNIVEKALGEVSWEELYERVFRMKFSKKDDEKPGQINKSQTQSPKSPKAMEIFPHIKPKSPLKDDLFAQKQQRLYLSPMRTGGGTILNNNQVDILNSNNLLIQTALQTSSSSSPSNSISTSTPTTTKSLNKKSSSQSLSKSSSRSPNQSPNQSRSKTPGQSPSQSNKSTESYSSTFESPSNGSASITSTPKSASKSELSVSERLDKIKKDYNLDQNDSYDIFNSLSSLSSFEKTSTKLSQLDLFKLTPDIDDEKPDILDDDATDNVSSIKSEIDILSELTESKSKPIEFVAEIDHDEIISSQCKRLWKFRGNKEAISKLESPYTRETPYKLFLFELCKEITLKEMKFDDSPKFTLKIPLRLQPKQWPNTLELFTKFIKDQINSIVNKQKRRPNVERDGLMGYCRAIVKRDFVDEILWKEMCHEEPLWSYYDPEIKLIKERKAQEEKLRKQEQNQEKQTKEKHNHESLQRQRPQPQPQQSQQPQQPQHSQQHYKLDGQINKEALKLNGF